MQGSGAELAGGAPEVPLALLNKATCSIEGVLILMIFPD